MRRVVVTGLGLVTPLGNELETTWSPARSSETMIAPIAAIPVLKVTVATPSSIRVIFSSSAVAVGLPWRP